MMEFCNAMRKENERVIEYVGRVQRIYTQLLQSGSTLVEENLVDKIVGGLTPAYHVFITNWANNSSLRQTMGELVPRLMSEESLITKMKKQDTVAMVADGSKVSNNKRNGSRGRRSGRSNGSGNRKTKSATCYNCNKPGHYARDCKAQKSDKQKQYEDKTTNKPTTSKKEMAEEEAIFAEGIVAESNYVNSEISDDWILDSGASDHMTYDMKSLRNYRVMNRKVRMGDFGSVDCVGMGDCELRTTDELGERPLVLRNVLHVPAMRRKLISVGAAAANSKIGEIMGDRIVLKNKSGDTVLVANKRHNLYVAMVRESAEIGSDLMNVEDNGNESDLMLWHERMAHVGRSTIVKMKKFRSVAGLDSVNSNSRAKMSDRDVVSCEACCKAKQTKFALPLSHRERARMVGTLHVDICSPIGVASLSGAKYSILQKG